ncbi:hypothetical protein A9Q84_06780 [Halobacteriovorax marinus]|uniref:Uncharacterized protein n=1 Tax=Halobacteriovorax marinus TaxID=97084 RepID=A0A1Y5FGC9_9BACT|nr:hypothetical protein A9Q84_06780 [Halobacteriovorax marinus]
MEIVRKSLFTFLDLSMDHFQINESVREKYLTYLISSFHLEMDIIKKWSCVGKGIDYHTFKTWIAKDNRFNRTTRKWPKLEQRITSHYHHTENVLEKMVENSYEDLLLFYEALSLLALFDKKCLMPRISFINWVADCLRLERGDCEIIRENILNDFELSFSHGELSKQAKNEVFLSGMNMAHISDELIDNNEIVFLEQLAKRFALAKSINHDLYFSYLSKNLAKGKSIESYSLHKISAVLLNLIGCDSSIDQSEVKWFKKYLSLPEKMSVRKYLSSDISKVIMGLSNEQRMLCYILGLELSMTDQEFHENEKFWLEKILKGLDTKYEISNDLFYIYLSVVEAHLNEAFRYDSFFLKPLEFFKGNRAKLCKNWQISQILFSKKVKTSELFNFLFEEDFIMQQQDQYNFLIEFSETIMHYKHDSIVSGNFHTLSSSLLTHSEEVLYSELLLSELLKISLLDGQLEQLEEEYLRSLQHKLEVSDRMMHRVVFYTSFLLGTDTTLRPHLNYKRL